MTKNKLTISSDLSLPMDFVVATDGIFASKGMGKSHLAQVAAEEMLELGQVVVAIDPTDAWWGLRSSADGKGDGYPIFVIGGDHGDVKLDPDSAVMWAETIVTERISVIICTDGLSDTAEIKFVRQFLDTLYRKNRKPLHVFVDEADIFAPQKPFEVEDSRCIRAMSHVVRRGRKKGIGTTIITQRPAELNASVRSQVEMLFVLGMLNNLDIDAVEKWLRLRKKKFGGDNAAFSLQEDMIESLDTLQQGDAWVWAPRQKIHKRFRARDKRTFDSGATPKPGKTVRVAKRLAPVDIAKLGATIAAAVERQKMDDPIALRQRLAELGVQLEQARRAKTVPAKVEKVAAIKDSQIKRVEQLTDKTMAIAATGRELLRAFVARQESAIARLEQEAALLRAALDTPKPQPYAPATLYAPGKHQSPPAARDASSRSAATPLNDGKLEPRQLRILTAVGWWESIGVREPSATGAAFIAGYSPTSSSFEKARGLLRTMGLIEYPSSGAIKLTDAGRRIAPIADRPATVANLHAAVLDQLEPRQARMLVPLIEAYPAAMTAVDLGVAAEASHSSSSFEKVKGKLRTLGLAEYPKPGFVRASDLLFPVAS